MVCIAGYCLDFSFQLQYSSCSASLTFHPCYKNTSWDAKDIGCQRFVRVGFNRMSGSGLESLVKVSI